MDLSHRIDSIIEKYGSIYDELNDMKKSPGKYNGKITYDSGDIIIDENEHKRETDIIEAEADLNLEFNISLNKLIFENSEYLHDIFVERVNNLNIKDCINFDDPDYVEGISFRDCNYLDKSDLYKVLLKGYSGITMTSCVSAIYLPVHIDVIYINKHIKVDLIDEPLSLEDMLKISKTIPEFNHGFCNRYKKVTLMKPFMPKNIDIRYDSSEDIFYYEALISSVELNKENLKNRKRRRNMCIDLDIDFVQYSYRSLITVVNNITDSIIKELGYRRNVYWFNFINVYIIEYIEGKHNDTSSWLGFSDLCDIRINHHHEKNMMTFTHAILCDVARHNDKVLGLLLDTKNCDSDDLDEFGLIYTI